MKLYNYIVRILMLSLCVISTLSCYRQNIVLRKDLTGVLTINAEVNKTFYDFVEISKDTKNSFDQNSFIFSDEKKIREEMRKYKIFRARTITVTDTELGKKFVLDLPFQKTDINVDFLLGKYIKNYIDEEKTTISVTTHITPGIIGNESIIKKNYLELNTSLKNTIDAFASIINITLNYSGPNEVVRSSNPAKGILTDNNKNIEYSFTLSEILQSNGPITITTTFKK